MCIRDRPSQRSRFLNDIPAELLKQGPRRGYGATQQTSMFTNRSRLERVTPSRGRSEERPVTQASAPTGSAKPGNVAFFAGQRVRHALFGEGVVVSSRLIDNDEEVTVAFAGKGVKRLLASFAKLEALR